MDLKSIKSLVIPINFKSFIIIFKDWQLYHDYINDYKILSSGSLLDVKGNMLNVGAIVNEDRSILENFWYGHIDEISQNH